MSAFLGALGGRLAERWMALMAIPGLAYLVAAATAVTLGQRHWHDMGRLRARIDALAAAPGAHSPGALAVVAVGVLAAAVAVATAAQQLGAGVERIWFAGAAGRLGERMAGRRLRRWREAHAAYRDALVRAGEARIAGAADATTLADAAERHLAARDRIARVPPRHPFWTGDRLSAPEHRVWRAYRLDLVAAWPHLWLLAPDGTRTELHSARLRLASAARLHAWGGGYLLLAVWWWPAAVIGGAAVGTAVVRGRAVAAAFADLVEALVDLHARDLATALGVDCPGRLTRATGETLSRALGKEG